MRVAVLDHGMGNLRSVAKALEAAGGAVSITSRPAEIERHDAVCVPGQGIFGRCMARLRATGMDDLIRGWVQAERPLLGICLGMQVLFESSEERGPVAGLGVFGGRVTRIKGDVRVPHIGWNTVSGTSFQDEYFYFDHSFAVHPADESLVVGWCEHGERFAASVRSGPVMAVEFHPEKSGASGISLLRGWVGAR